MSFSTTECMAKLGAQVRGVAWWYEGAEHDDRSRRQFVDSVLRYVAEAQEEHDAAYEQIEKEPTKC